MPTMYAEGTFENVTSRNTFFELVLVNSQILQAEDKW